MDEYVARLQMVHYRRVGWPELMPDRVQATLDWFEMRKPDTPPPQTDPEELSRFERRLKERRALGALPEVVRGDEG